MQRKLTWIEIEVMAKEVEIEVLSSCFVLWWCRSVCKEQGFILGLKDYFREPLKTIMMQTE